ncbi:MAG: 4'-phosphopantetheinyl transferase superfamily protein [Planctomycetota bacterium]|nr:4'-phosphopantetheinyl transferase superfamily protein [Planctomycetota bacterium]
MKDLLPPPVVLLTAPIGACQGELFPEEHEPIERAVEKRRREFTAGRVLARRALEQLGRPPVAIPTGSQRQPVWPDGVVGSIAHTNTLCAVALSDDPALLGLGIDMEPAEALPDGVLRRVCRPEERDWLAAQPPEDRALLERLFFCAKEAVFKCTYPRAEVWFGFEDATVQLDTEAQHFEAQLHLAASEDALPGVLRGRIAHAEGHVWAATVWRDQAASR